MEELEVLESIYMDDLKVEKNERGSPLSMQLLLHPATGDELDKRYVCMTLTLKISDQYPDEAPEIILSNPRGIAEEEVQSLLQELEKLADEKIGGEMLYEIIELAKEGLTEGNVPYCPCTICCEHFTEEDIFTKTDCYHYFHDDCLRRYLQHQLDLLQQEKETQIKHIQRNEDSDKIKCPVCREEITYTSDFLQSETTNNAKDDIKYCPTDNMRVWQKEMAEVYKKQKEKGGIIDVEAEKNRYLLTDSDGEIPIIITKADAGISNEDASKDGKSTNKLQSSNQSNSQGRKRFEGRENFTKESRQNDRFHRDTRGHRSPRDNYPGQGSAGKQRNYYDKRPSSGYSDRRGFHRGDNSKFSRNDLKPKTKSKTSEKESSEKSDKTDEEASESTKKTKINLDIEQDKVKLNDTDDLKLKNSTESVSPDHAAQKKVDVDDEGNLSDKMLACNITESNNKVENDRDNKKICTSENQVESNRYEDRGQSKHKGDSIVNDKGKGQSTSSEKIGERKITSASKNREENGRIRSYGNNSYRGRGHRRHAAENESDNKFRGQGHSHEICKEEKTTFESKHREESSKTYNYDNRRYGGRGQRRHAGDTISDDVRGHGHYNESSSHGYRNKGDYHNYRQNRFHDEYDADYRSGHKRFEYREKGHKRGQDYSDGRKGQQERTKERIDKTHDSSSIGNKTGQDYSDGRKGQQERTKERIDKTHDSIVGNKTNKDVSNDRTSDTKKVNEKTSAHLHIQDDSSRTRKENNDVKSTTSVKIECDINSSDKSQTHKSDVIGKSDRRPPGFVVKGLPPGFSEKSVKPPPGF